MLYYGQLRNPLWKEAWGGITQWSIEIWIFYIIQFLVVKNFLILGDTFKVHQFSNQRLLVNFDLLLFSFPFMFFLFIIDKINSYPNKSSIQDESWNSKKRKRKKDESWTFWTYLFFRKIGLHEYMVVAMEGKWSVQLNPSILSQVQIHFSLISLYPQTIWVH